MMSAQTNKKRPFRFILSLLSAVVLTVSAAAPHPAFAVTSDQTTAGQTINQGTLSLTLSSGSLEFPAVTAGTTSQISSAVMSQINVNNARGTADGWSLSLNMENLTFTSNPLYPASNSSPLITLSSNSRYDGACGAGSTTVKYEIVITTNGDIGTARYSVTGGCAGESNQTDVLATGASSPVGSRGILVDFPEGSYASGDKWIILTDVYPYTGAVISPQTPTAALPGSDLDGVSAGASESLAGTSTISNGKILLTADSGKGMGSYNQDVNLDLTVHSYSLTGIYSGLIYVSVF